MLKRGKSLYAKARAYHRRKEPWTLNAAGLRVIHAYDERKPDDLSWWDDFGLVFAKRRVMVWWRHPRLEYRERLSQMAYERVPAPEKDDWELRSTPLYRRFPRSRRKFVVGHQLTPFSEAHQHYFRALDAMEASLGQSDQGIVVRPSCKSSALDWCQGIDLVAPLEVRCEDDLVPLADLVRRYLRGDWRMLEEYPDYTFADWEREKPYRKSRKTISEKFE